MTTLRAEAALAQAYGLRITRSAFRRLPLALLSLALNLPLALAGVHRGAYDTYVHIFLADHYRLNWFELREFRWYTGFSVASYPPLVHQVIALLSWPLSVVAAWFAPAAPLPGVYRYRGEELAYVVVLLAVLAAFPYAVRSFAAMFVGPRAARWAGVLAVFCPALGLTAWSFGQLPTLAGTTLFLFAFAQGNRFVRDGQRPALVRSVALAAAAAAAHHGTLLFALVAGPAIVIDATLTALIGKTRTLYPPQRAQGRWRNEEKRSFASPARPPQRAEIFAALRCNGAFGPARRSTTRRWPGRALRLRALASRYPLARGAIWALLCVLVIALVLWPFLKWSAGYQPQTPIDHGSRHSFLADPAVTLAFFWPAYGVLLLLLPWAAYAAVKLPRLRALAMVTGQLFVLGLGGTTPLPRWLYGSNWEWLTYDRFAFWAAVCLLPFAGAFLIRFRRLFAVHSSFRIPRSAFLIVSWSLVILSALYGSLLSVITRAQPTPVDLVPIAEFLAQGANDQWRYLTFGFGDQAARLAVLTTAGTPDGSYHTARELPLLRASGVGQLDALLWEAPGAEGIRPFLEAAAAPDGWAVRWVFVDHPAYLPALRQAGWTFDRLLGNGIQVWRKDRVWPVAPWTLAKSGPTPAALWWGTAPLAALAAAASLAALDERRLRLALRAARAVLFGAVVLTFPIGWHQVLYVNPSPGVFLSYRGVLVFASDSFLVALLAVWLLERRVYPETAGRLRWGSSAVLGWLGLLGAAVLSAPGSADAWLTTAFVFHLALLGGLYLYLQAETPAWNTIAWLLIAQLCLQAALGLSEFAAQSTVLAARFRLPFVAALTPDMPGASVVQTAGGARWLRAYGSLWHPNVLGAVLLLCLGGPLLNELRANNRTEVTKGTDGNTPRWISLISFSLGLAVLALSFSRSAWVGGLAAAVVLFVLLPRGERRRLWPAAAVGAVTLALVAIPFTSLFFTRATADSRSPLEQLSVNDREAVARVALDLARQRPWTGVGAGAFVQALAAAPDIVVTREPVHSVPLLVLAEMGLPGALALAALALGVGRDMLRRRRPSPQAAVFTALLVGLAATSLFDHFLWSSAPGRTLAALALGLWAAASREGE